MARRGAFDEFDVNLVRLRLDVDTEEAFGRQRDVHDLREVHLEDGQEEFDRRAADVEIFHGRDALDSRNAIDS